MKVYSPFMAKYRAEQKRIKKEAFADKLDRVSGVILFSLVGYLFVCMFMQCR